MDVLIIGGGVAGLTCARLLEQAGTLSVTLLESSTALGGRVQSDHADGYTFDHGFQVLFDAYPAVQRQLDLAALNLRFFDPGAIICKEGRRSILTDPFRDPELKHVVASTLTPIVTPLDKLRILQLERELQGQTISQVLEGPDMSTLDYLRLRGFSQTAIDNFFRPFFGGIFLDTSLTTSAKNFKFNFKMLSDGSACVPAAGMGAISQQLAQTGGERVRVRLGVRVAALLTERARVVGVRLGDGSDLRADAVVLATPAPEAARISGLPLPTDYVQTVTLYFGGYIPLTRSKKIVLNAAEDAFVNNAQLMSNVAPDYAPEGRHLLSATIIGIPSLDDEELFARALADVRLMFCGDERAQLALDTYRPLRLYRISYAQFVQTPNIHLTLPGNESGRTGLYFAAEFTEASSINAAIISGEKCAELLIQQAATQNTARTA